MMQQSLFIRQTSPDVMTRLRKRYLSTLLVLMVISGTLGAIAQLFLRTPGGLPSTLIFMMTGLALLFLVNRGYMALASIVMMAGLILTGYVFPLLMPLMGTLAVITAAVMSGNLVYTLANLGVYAGLFLVMVQAVSQNTSPEPSPEAVQASLLLVALGIVSFTTRYFIGKTNETAQSSAQNAKLLQAAAETGQQLTHYLDLKELLPNTVDIIREKFGFYHVQIFLLDEARENARLAASTGAVGQKLLERHHSLPVGSNSVIGRTTATKTAVIAGSSDSSYYRNELLPNTRLELALPLMDGDEVIGALDIQSSQSDSFSEGSIRAFEVLANILGTSIRNARSFEGQQQAARESQRLYLESETNLREIRRLNQQLTGAGWSDYLGRRQSPSGVALDHKMIVSDVPWSDTLSRATEERHAIIDEKDGQRVVAVPLMIGGEVIGAVEVEASSQSEDVEVLEMVNAIAQRLAISLDKARLFEESQEATAREQRINEIIARFQMAAGVDELLQMTIEELGRSLGATHSAIRLSVAPLVGANGDGHA
ncbi:MAG: GAF domain-containing protein [Anaerolineae bacterium]|nr:GAF domain-containing protein [Anaerolineae bacterium]